MGFHQVIGADVGEILLETNAAVLGAESNSLGSTLVGMVMDAILDIHVDGAALLGKGVAVHLDRQVSALLDM